MRQQLMPMPTDACSSFDERRNLFSSDLSDREIISEAEGTNKSQKLNSAVPEGPIL